MRPLLNYHLITVTTTTLRGSTLSQDGEDSSEGIDLIQIDLMKGVQGTVKKNSYLYMYCYSRYCLTPSLTSSLGC